MAGLEELALALLGKEAQTEIAGYNPYLQFASVPQTFSSTMSNAPAKSRKELWQNAAAASVGGLLGGALTGMGQNYQTTLTNRYTDAIASALSNKPISGEGLPGGLFGSVQQKAKLFNVINSLKAADTATELEKQQKLAEAKGQMDLQQEVVKALLKNPRQASRALPLLGNLFTKSTKVETPTESVETVETPTNYVEKRETPSETLVVEEPKVPLAGVEGTLLGEAGQGAEYLMDTYGAPPGQAFTTVNQIQSSKREELDRQYKRIEEAEKSADAMASLVNEMQLSLQGAGKTGKFGELKQLYAGVAGALGSTEQKQKYAAGQDVESRASEVIGLSGRTFKGPMSDRDVQLMLKKGPQLGYEKDANQAILGRWAFAAELQRRYVDFMRAAQAKGVSVSEAEAAWSKIKRDNPYVIKQGSEYKINPTWVGEMAATGTSGGAPAVGQMFNGQKVISVKKIK